MGWDDRNRRRTAIDAVLAYAAEHPSAGLPFEAVPEARASFKDRRELVLALQYEWTQSLWARIELLSLDGGKQGRGVDARHVAKTAWAHCAAKRPVLRRLLDCYRDEIGPSVVREQEISTSAGILHCASSPKAYQPSIA
jgi:hypothetical protein